jgi:hypothetical protein
MNAKNLQKQLEEDGEEIQVPKSIQDLIVRNIRTLSNSLSSKNQSAKAIQEAIESAHEEIKINSINKSMLNNVTAADLKELRESWLTKAELRMLQRSPEGRKNSLDLKPTKPDDINLRRNRNK